MKNNNNTQLQIRIDERTKREARKVFETYGLDISTAVKMMLKQAIFTKRIPFEVRDENGFTPQYREILDEAIKDVEISDEIYESTDDLFKALSR